MQRFRPLSLGDIFDEAFDLYKRNLAFLLLIAAVAAVPLQIIVGLAYAQFLRQFLPLANSVAGSGANADPFQLLSNLSSSLAGLMAASPFYLIGWGLEWCALAAAASAGYLGGKPTLWSVYQAPLKRFFPMLITSLLVALALFAGVTLCGFGLIFTFPIAATLFLFTAHTFTLERKNYGSALGRSNALVGGHGGRVFGCLLVLTALVYVLDLGLQLPLVYLMDLLLNVAPGSAAMYGGGAAAALDARQQLASQLAAGLSNLALMPFVVCVVTVLYYDLRIRKEGYDIEMLAGELGYPDLGAMGGYLPPAPVFPAMRPPVVSGKAGRR